MAKARRSYLASIWNWLRDGENRKVIAWIGSGLMVAIGALVYQNSRPDSEPGATPPPAATSPSAGSHVTVGEGVGVGGDLRVDGDLNVNSGPRGDEESPQK